MTRLLKVRHEYVEYIPDQLTPGVLYISVRFRTASHLCCCGCGLKVVTPLNPAKWSLTDHGAGVSLSPSVGNWGYPCRSHYRIIRNQIHWGGQLNHRQIAAVQQRDRMDVERHATTKSPAAEQLDHRQIAEALRRDHADVEQHATSKGLLVRLADAFKRWLK
ncbi:DUF6527 family protein [Burkholderia sp. BCC1985]|uniref:DUF6527 family protein n=1 Tax=unclassified Burkholderia TaxID=2613784 RepID=UPI0039F0183B